jgi:hypothetical protein
VNDLNGWLTNLWRSIKHDPDGVAYYADHPVSELDSQARGNWLFHRRDAKAWIERMRADPEYYDVKSAGFWIYGQCCWVGYWGPVCDSDIGNEDCALYLNRPDLGSGKGVMAHRRSGAEQDVKSYLRQLAERLHDVRICCGDWSRVCTNTPTVLHGLTGIVFDPPYAVDDRSDVYGDNEDKRVAVQVRKWCVKHGDNKLLRIVYCGYKEEGRELEEAGWQCVGWKAVGGYQSQNSGNNKRERLWFSKHCLKPDEVGKLFW